MKQTTIKHNTLQENDDVYQIYYDYLFKKDCLNEKDFEKIDNLNESRLKIEIFSNNTFYILN